MSRIKERLKQYYDEYSEYSKYDGLLVSDVMDMLEQLQDDLEHDEKQNNWIPVAERMPEERDSIFAKFKGTGQWNPNMFEKTSEKVLATVGYPSGARITETVHTIDGKWKTDIPPYNGKVIAWMPFPEPYNEDCQNYLKENENG